MYSDPSSIMVMLSLMIQAQSYFLQQIYQTLSLTISAEQSGYLEVMNYFSFSKDSQKGFIQDYNNQRSQRGYLDYWNFNILPYISRFFYYYYLYLIFLMKFSYGVFVFRDLYTSLQESIFISFHDKFYNLDNEKSPNSYNLSKLIIINHLRYNCLLIFITFCAMDSQDLCVVPNFIELEYHEQQQMHCHIKLINKLDQVISFKIKTNYPAHYLVKPMEGLIYKKEQIKILFRRKELTTQQFQYFMVNPNMQAKQKFIVQIQATQSDAMGRAKKIHQTSYISAKFVKNKGLAEKTVDASRLTQQHQSPRIKSNLKKYKQQYEHSRGVIQSLRRQLQIQAITNRQFILLIILAFLFGFALL